MSTLFVKNSVEKYSPNKIFNGGTYGRLVYVVKEEVLKHNDLRYKVYYSRDNEPPYVYVDRKVKTWYLHNGVKDDGYLIDIYAPINSERLNIVAVEFKWKDGMSFIMKRSVPYMDPYRPEIKIETTLKVNEEQQITATNMDTFMELLKNIPTMEEQLEIDEKEKMIVKNKPKVVEDEIIYGIDVTKAVYRKPKDGSTLFVPFWCNHSHWVYYSRQFKIGETDIPLTRIKELEIEERARRRLFYKQGSDFSLIKIEEMSLNIKPEPNMGLLFDEEFANMENFRTLYNYCNEAAYMALTYLGDRCLSIGEYTYHEIDNGSTFACMSYKRNEKSNTPIVPQLPKMFYNLYGVEKPNYNKRREVMSVVICLKLNFQEPLGVKLILKDAITKEVTEEVVYGKMKQTTDDLDYALDVFKQINKTFSEKGDVISQELLSKIQQKAHEVMSKGVVDIPFHVYLDDQLTRYIIHPLLPMPIASLVGSTTSLEDVNMIREFTDIYLTGKLAV